MEKAHLGRDTLVVRNLAACSAANGGGKSPTRKAPALYGNDPNNWTTQLPSPGS